MIVRCVLGTSSGYTNLPPNTIDPSSVSVSFNPPASAANITPLRLLTNGEPEEAIDEARASELLKEEDLEIVIDLGVKEGGEEATYWTCDFSHVRFFPTVFILLAFRVAAVVQAVHRREKDE